MSRPLKILIDARFLGRNPYSGVEEYGNQVIRHLPRLAPENEYQIIKNRFFGIPNKIFRWLPVEVDRFVKTDLIYSPHLNFLKHSPRTPRILTIHDLSFLHFPHFFSRRDRFWHWTQRVKKQAGQAALIITDSQFSKNDIAEALKIPDDKIKVIYPGINPGISQIPRTCDVQNIEKLKPFILYLGKINPRKNLEILLRAFNLLTSQVDRLLKLVIAGDDQIPNTLIPPSLNSQIILTGPVSPEEKLLLYNQAEVFVYPSFFEGFGFPPLEAQSCGCPVIVSNRASLPEIIGRSGLQIDPWRTEELVYAIRAVLTNQDLRRRLTALGRQNVQRFNWLNASQELLKYFSSVSF